MRSKNINPNPEQQEYDLVKKEKGEMILFLIYNAYAAVNTVIGIVYWFTFQQVVSLLVTSSGLSTWTWKTFDYVGVFVYGLLFISFIMILQHLYRKQLEKRRFPPLFAYVTGAQIVIFALSLLYINGMR